VSALALPFLTEADPDRAGEGSLDPLGLAPIADRLADSIAPEITARMNRIRFLTLIAAGASIAAELGDVVGADERTPAYLAYEWIVVEALARKRPPGETEGVPGIQKARRAITRSRDAHLDSGAYLQVPKVFGFHGVYKRLARATGLVDQQLLALGEGDALIRVWEREQRLPGFADRVPRTDGGDLAKRLIGEVRKALAEGRVATSPGSWLWSRLATAMGPDDAGPRERDRLWRALINDREPIRQELILGLQSISTGEEMSEAGALRALAPQASPALRDRLEAIDRYERFAWLLSAVFLAMRARSTSQGRRAIMPAELADNEHVVLASSELPEAARRAADAVAIAGQELAFEAAFSRFAEPIPPAELVEAVLEHHDGVQDAKGKRPWIDRMEPGFTVRPRYNGSDEASGEGEYIHPYRVQAISNFIRDLGRER
jgi:hypothetical protein